MPALFGSFIPLSIDLFLPALPKMTEALGASAARVNLTLSLLFVFLPPDEYGNNRDPGLFPPIR